MDVGNEEDYEEAKLIYDEHLAEDNAFVGEMLDSYAGRAVLWRVICLSGVYRAPVTHPQDTFREVGKQDLGREIQEWVFTIRPGCYRLMREECEGRDNVRKKAYA